MTDRKEYNRKYREKNKEKIAEYNRKYREKNKEKLAEKRKQYRIDNKDKVAERDRKFNEKYKKKQKEWREENKDKIKEYHKDRYNTHIKDYRQTEEGKKNNRISKWKVRGIICDDWDVLYERYLNTELCELCNCKLTEDKINTKTTKCLDHNHETGEVRNIVCHSCNVRRK